MSNQHDRAVFCTADDRSKAISIVEKLRASGFRESEISLIVAHEDADGEIAIEGNTKAPEGASTGAGGGMLLGTALGWMAGIGALAIPGLGPFIAAGPIMAALGGAALGAAAGGIAGGLIGMGFSEYEAKQYESYVKAGHSLISVVAETDEEVDRAKEIYKDADAEHIAVQEVVEVS
ncbi:MAG TPA: hypothetical protein VMM76_03695 [Pirellulaceae bacterium]|nr:hypothetical protein [Pirellulaceae bacterium]